MSMDLYIFLPTLSSSQQITPQLTNKTVKLKFILATIPTGILTAGISA